MIKLYLIFLFFTGIYLNLYLFKFQDNTIDILIPGNEYSRYDLPAKTEGNWMTLHYSEDKTMLETLNVKVESNLGCSQDPKGELIGRSVKVLGAADPIVLIRGAEFLKNGEVYSNFIGKGYPSEQKQITTTWNGKPLTLSHVTKLPTNDQLGSYQIILKIGKVEQVLHKDQWHGDGHWRVRWIGDLDADGWPDILLDASHKYSIYSTRLFLTTTRNDQIMIKQKTVFTHFSC